MSDESIDGGRQDPSGRQTRPATRVRVIALYLAGLAAIVVVALLLLRSVRPELVLAEGNGLTGSGIDLLEQENAAYALIARTVTPSIVNIQTTAVVKAQQSPSSGEPLLRRFFGPPEIPREQREHALGSGVIISPNGYVVTNNHVIAHATEIQVMLPDRRAFKGKVVGADPQSDLAVLELDATGLPAITWGDSSALAPGDIVMAFGNPFGLNFTVTRGSVSAVGRSGLGIESFEDFIQTDAPINPGNSGGALVDVRGRLVGINTAIVSPGGGGAFAGVGFAIPSNAVKRVITSLIKTGKVVRGYLGVEVSDIDEPLARKFHVPDLSGALVSNVTSGSPGAKAGLKPGDVLRTYDSKRIDSKDSLSYLVASVVPGTKIHLGILRQGKPMTVEVTLGERPAGELPGATEQAVSQGTLRGITVRDLTPAVRNQLEVPEEVQGAVVSALDPASPAARQGIQVGDVIMEVDRQPIANAADFLRLAGNRAGEVLVRIYRRGMVLFLVLSPSTGAGK